MIEPRTRAAGSAVPAAAPVTLAGLPPGTARVATAVVRPEETWLDLGYPGGRQLTVAVPAVPRHDVRGSSTRPMRPVAVRITTRREGLECSVVATTPSGPTRLRISIGQALAWCVSGVHTVFCRQ